MPGSGGNRATPMERLHLVSNIVFRPPSPSPRASKCFCLRTASRSRPSNYSCLPRRVSQRPGRLGRVFLSRSVTCKTHATKWRRRATNRVDAGVLRLDVSAVTRVATTKSSCAAPFICSSLTVNAQRCARRRRLNVTQSRRPLGRSCLQSNPTSINSSQRPARLHYTFTR